MCGSSLILVVMLNANSTTLTSVSAPSRMLFAPVIRTKRLVKLAEKALFSTKASSSLSMSVAKKETASLMIHSLYDVVAILAIGT